MKKNRNSFFSEYNMSAYNKSLFILSELNIMKLSLVVPCYNEAENVAAFHKMGGLLAAGTDAGAWAVPHGSETEYTLLHQALGDQTLHILTMGIQKIQEKF